MGEPRTLTVKELKTKLAERGISFEGVIEKSELIALLEKSPCSVSCSFSAPIAMSVTDLRDVVRSLAGRTSQCTEKKDLFNLAKDLLKSKTCVVCLDGLLESLQSYVVRVPCCSGFFHVACLSDWIFNSTLEGIFPHKCPSCSKELDEYFVTRHVIKPGDVTGKYLRYIAALESLKNLKSGSSSKSSTLTPAEEKQLRELGCRPCPKCGSWIEKGPSMEAFGIPIAEGCDKMTCRCGCKFCYKCGSINATCDCTSKDHGFFSHSDVMSDYPRSHLENTASGGVGGLFNGLSNLFQ